ncbi:MAG: undecaprenyl-phosphate glucose phosphotransferase [Bdellovibrionota bacterium]|jgi:Undecaprenyl-phosphate glucose phosphotransferase
MLKQKRQLFEILFIAADLIAVTVAWILSYWLRFESGFIPVDKGIPEIGSYLMMLLFIWVIWAFVFRKMGLYRPMRGVRRIREVWLLLNANALSILLLLSFTYLLREKSVPYSRLVFVYFGTLATIFTLLQRASLRFLLREVRRRGYNLRYLLIVGAGNVAGDIATRLRLHRELGLQLVGCLSKTGQESRGPKGIPIVGSYAELSALIQKLDIDQVMVCLPLEDNALLPDIMAQIGDSLVDVRIVPDIYQFVTLGGEIEEFEGLPVINLRSTQLDGINLVAKRFLDIVLGSLILFILSPLLLLLALLVKLTSRGPVLFKQERVSVDGSHFSILKFRTMRTDAEERGPGWTTEGDSRVTKLGGLLRKWSLDELPQLVNVIRGDMSMVGPRPERPVFIKEFRTHIPRYMLRHKVPAGITGWAQVNGWRGDTSIDKRIECDLYYIENWSLLLDLKILFLTIFRGFRNKNAY